MVCWFGVFAFLVLAFGWVRVVRFALAALSLLLVWRSRGVCWAVACAGRWRVLGGGAWAAIVGAGQSCPAPCGVVVPSDACAWKREGGCVRGVVNTPLSCGRLHGNG